MLLAAFALICAFGTSAHAASYEPYEGNPSNTYIQYFKDIISGIRFNENYVAFRSAQNEYILVVGDLEYNDGIFVLNETGRIYTMSSENSYNSYYKYERSSIDTFELNPRDKIVYSDLGEFPQLVERGAKYEMLNTLLLVIALLGIVLSRIFRHS